MSRRAAASIAFLIACGGSRTDPEQEVVLRVSAVAGLSDLVPSTTASGSSAAARDLVFDDPDPYIESMSAEGSSVVLVRRDSAPVSAEELAASLRSQGLVSARVLDARRIEARFAEDRTAALVAQYGSLGFDLGPFEVESQEPGRIRLNRRGISGIDVIELVESSRADEWRQLLGHELDIVPWASISYRSQFAGLSSIRILEIPARGLASIYFNVRAPALADARVRRRIAASLHRQAIARLACGDPSCALADIAQTADDVDLPPRLVIVVPKNDTALLTAAKVLRHQLWPLGVELEIQPAAVQAMMERMTAGDFDLALGPMAMSSASLEFFLSPGHPKGISMTGFASPEFDAAFDRGDVAAAQAILDREMPVTRIFELRSFAAIDARFCGEVTPSEASWRWISGLYPCEEGPPQ